ncbi:probable G-protein coupled receptor 139 [Argopecten irradians]|uniref:probable G-protein coupled receptor 139 n=1 Tax=Argopecten irradians TaxID=31199 RepID=UPI0037139F52
MCIFKCVFSIYSLMSPETFSTMERVLYHIRHMSQEERDILMQHFNLSNEEQLLNFSGDPEVPIEDFTSFRVHKVLLLYVPPIMVLVGTIGNILSFAVFRTNSGKVSTYTYLSALAIMDLLVLYVGLLPLWISQLSGHSINDHANWTCKMGAFLGYVCSDSSVWLIVAVTVERYIAVCFPLKASFLCRIRKAKYIVVVLLLILCSLNSHFLWTVQLRHVGNNATAPVYVCDASPNFSDLVNHVWVWIDAGMYSFVPFVILLILNARIVHKVWVAKNERKHITERRMSTCNADKSPAGLREASTKVTVMLLTISFTFLLTTLPMNVILILTKTWNEQSQRQRANFHLAKTVSEILMYLNHTVNFFLYCISGRKFRLQIISSFRNLFHSRTKPIPLNEIK